jgi:mannose-6-phosphate isomerase-like protein (cupin superfamily)
MTTPANRYVDRRTVLGAFAAAASAMATPSVRAHNGQSPSGNGQWISAFGLRMKLEVTTASTGGAMSATRVISPPNGGPPAHIHSREDEVFLILRGHYRFWQKGVVAIDAPAGTVVQQRKGMIHQYRNVGNEEGEHILICLPGGLEELFVRVAHEKLVVPRDMTRVVELSAQYGVTYYPSIAD